MTSWLVSGLPRQFMEIWAKSRCSIRFHFEVPGGKWDTLISRPSSSASLASSTFHSRSRLPLEPPGGDEQPGGVRAGGLADLLPPAADRLDREGPGAGIGAGVHPAGIGRQVIDAV